MLGFTITVIAGLVVGTINGMAGGASLISYPVLLALGLPPVDAAITNALGVSSANLFAIRAGQHTAVKLIKEYKRLIIISVVCSLIGATLLLIFPPNVFEHVVPFLLLAATLTLLLPTKPHVSRRNEVVETLGIASSGLYCGYFGPGQGVMVITALARNPKDPGTLNAAKNIIVGITSMASNLVYIFSGHAHWSLAFALFLGSSVGGTLGGRWATKMSPLFYRVLVMSVGFGASIWLFIKYFF
ncbi:MAG: sulfite exporter TauE/SafE family protein [Candidatus Nanopelagicaceae bacterium]|nr:sulfite exporter TauE/SafE family protein [Candidatus Nanopelagicaceae bacterium]